MYRQKWYWDGTELEKVLDTQEFYRFISIFKDIAPYHLKIHQANGCIEILDKGEIQIFQQLKNELKPYYEKLDKAWFS
ncbi:hypothetical protein [Rummeliibacillus pycnus]|uniref:hypothetical protein n=1 Tax=Rummeliibacillus pycnus TaxID=101070 RepID=UPI0037CBD374